jgi:hypothetical protein
VDNAKRRKGEEISKRTSKQIGEDRHYNPTDECEWKK